MPKAEAEEAEEEEGRESKDPGLSSVWREGGGGRYTDCPFESIRYRVDRFARWHSDSCAVGIDRTVSASSTTVEGSKMVAQWLLRR